MSMPYSSLPRRKVRYSPVAASRLPAEGTSAWPELCTSSMDVLRAMCSMTRLAYQAADVQDQGHPPVTHDGGAGDIVNLAVIGFEVLHHHLLLAEQFVDQQGHSAAFSLDH